MPIFVSGLGCLKEPISKQDAIRISWLLTMWAREVGRASFSRFGPLRPVSVHLFNQSPIDRHWTGLLLLGEDLSRRFRAGGTFPAILLLCKSAGFVLCPVVEASAPKYLICGSPGIVLKTNHREITRASYGGKGFENLTPRPPSVATPSSGREGAVPWSFAKGSAQACLGMSVNRSPNRGRKTALGQCWEPKGW